MSARPTAGPLADISNVSRISHRNSFEGKGQVSIAFNPDDSSLPPPPPKRFSTESTATKGNILSPNTNAGKPRDHSIIYETETKSNESLVGREVPTALGMRVRLTEDEKQEFADQSGNGGGKIVSIAENGQTARVLWDVTGQEAEYPTGDANFYFLRPEAVEADPTHGLGEPVISAPSLSIHAYALTEAVSISSAPKPAMLEPESEIEQSTALSQFKLGMAYLQGRGVQQDLTKAIEWFTKSAENGDRNAQFNLGVCYTQGLGVAENLEEAYKYFKMSADQEDTKALLQVGVCYILGRGVEQSEELAAKCFRKAAEHGDTTAQYNLGVCLGKGRGLPKNVKEAALWYRKAAEQGDSMAQFRLALCLATGKGVEKDLEQAVELYEQAAAQKHGGALFNLGVCFAQGDGVKQNDAKAVENYRTAANLGVVQAQHNLALCLLTGVGVAKDLEQALTWYLKAAAQGDAKAQFAAGVCFETGQGTEKDQPRAAGLYKEAVERGNVKAAVALGLCYKSGAGLEAEPAEALRLFTLAADKGNHRGMFNLGLWYASASPPDLDLAAEWYAKAAEKGNPEAISALKSLARMRRSEEEAKAPAALGEEAMAEQGGEKTAGAEAEKKERKSWGAESAVTAAPAPAQAPPQHKNRAVLPHPNSPIPLPKARPGIREAPIHSPAAKVRCGLGALFGRKKK